jgi:two-component system, OmpR family, KDP operon response regulator KdpE
MLSNLKFNSGEYLKTIIVSNDKQVVRDVSFCLQVRYQNCEIIAVSGNTRGLDTIKIESPDLIILDSTLSEITPYDLISNIRKFSDVAIIALYSDQNGLEKAGLLEAGADEYMHKSFSPIMFLALINAVLRRTEASAMKRSRTLSIRNLTLNFSVREVLNSGKRIHLTPTEYNLLVELVRNADMLLTNKILLEKVWGPDYSDEPDLVKKYIFRLRHKLEDNSTTPQMIVNERGIGYKFVSVSSAEER